MPLFGPFNPAQLASAGRRAVADVTRRARPDHLAINRGRTVMFSPQVMRRVYLYAVLAPEPAR